ncbi:MAG: GNAT family N-acetyltransferase [Candidatus Binataceae bacterium]
MKVDAPIRVRRAVPDEAPALTEVALRSKAYWGYDARFMAAARHDLEFRPEDFSTLEAYVLEVSGRMAGFFSLRPLSAEGIELHDLWIEPKFIGTGYGKMLWLHAIDLARARGFRLLRLTADPNAELFYLRHGATRIGDEPSSIRAERRMPVLQYKLVD